MGDERQQPDHSGHRQGDAGDKGVSGAAFASMGLQFAVSLIVFVFLGQWADRRFDTSPLFLILGVFVGGGASFYAIYRQLMAAQRREEERRK
jgi:F0F1-type ATP synthase assembly protein I